MLRLVTKTGNPLLMKMKKLRKRRVCFKSVHLLMQIWNLKNQRSFQFISAGKGQLLGIKS